MGVVPEEGYLFPLIQEGIRVRHERYNSYKVVNGALGPEVEELKLLKIIRGGLEVVQKGLAGWLSFGT